MEGVILVSAMSEAKKRANKKWNDANMKERYDRVQLVLPKGRKTALQAAAEQHGQSVNGFINSLIDEALEREGAGAVPAVSPTAEDGPGVDMVSAGGSPDKDSSSRSILLAPPQKSAQPQVSIYKELGSLSPEELEKRMGCDPESAERYRERTESKRKRLAELNAKAGGLSRAEDAERRRLMAECGNSTQE